MAAFVLEAVFVLGALVTLALLAFRPVLTEVALRAAELHHASPHAGAAP